MLLSQILKKDRHALTHADKTVILTEIQKLMRFLWQPPYEEDQNGNWLIQYLRGDNSYDYLQIKNVSDSPIIAFEKLFDTHDFKRLMQMAINLFLKNVDSKNQ
jgi:hypothetical protein